MLIADHTTSVVVGHLRAVNLLRHQYKADRNVTASSSFSEPKMRTILGLVNMSGASFNQGFQNALSHWAKDKRISTGGQG